MSGELTVIGGLTGVTDLFLGRIPMISFWANTLATPASMAQLLQAMDKGKIADTSMYIQGIGQVPVSSATLSVTADALSNKGSASI